MHCRLSLLHSTTFCLLLLLQNGYVQSMLAEEWKSRSIYQVVTDRFAPTSAASETAVCNTGSRQYCGGTWQGIIRRLDYIQGMGFDAIWISPITKQIDNNTAYGEAYHGYWQQDIYSLNPHFGTASDLKALSAALHARGMALMVDVVVNHFGSPYEVDYSIYTPFNDGAYFHQEAFITDYNDQTLVEQGWLGDGNVPLPDVDTENVDIVNTFNNWISGLVQTYQIDGLRLDTVKHIRKDFWPGFVNSAGVFALGEVLSGDPTYLSAYQPYVGGLLDYATYYPLLRAFVPGGSMYEVTALLAPSYRARFTDTQLLATFMENHDQPRFPYSTSADSAVVRNALAYTMLSDGIPIIYYGQEQSFNGGGDPNNREALWPSSYKITDLYTYIAKLNIARNLAWSAGFATNLTTGLYVDTTTSVSQKGPLLLVLSNQGSTAANKTISFSSSFSAGTILVNVLTCNSLVVGKSSTSVTVVAGAPQVYLPQGLAQKMCTNIIPPTSTTSSVLTKITSLFTSSTKAAAKSTAKSSQSTYNSGTTAKTSASLAITKASPSSTSTLAKTTTSSSYKTSSTQAAGRAGFQIATTTSPRLSSTSTSTVKPTTSSARTTSSSTSTKASTTSSARPTTTTSANPTKTSTSANKISVSTSTDRISTSAKITSTSRATSSSTKLTSTSRSSTTTAIGGRAGFVAATTTSTPVGGRAGFAVVPTTSTSVEGRAGFAAMNDPSAQQQRKRGLNDAASDPQSPVFENPRTPQQRSNAWPQGRKHQSHMHTTTTPPASFSQHYREERSTTKAISPHAPSGLSSTYSYSTNQLPNSNAFSQKDRSSSEGNLNELQYKKGHKSQSQSLHTLRKQSSHNSLRPQQSRANSFNGEVPSIPALNKLDTRAALFADNAPYVHADLLSTHSLVPPPIPNSRRSSGNSVYSFKSERYTGGTTSSGPKRGRRASVERNAILAQEFVGAPEISSQPPSRMLGGHSNGIMQNSQYGSSRTSLHSKHGSTHFHGNRRIDQRPQLQEDIRNYRV